MQAYDNAAPITPDDSTVFSPVYDAIYAGVAGNVAVVTDAGSAVTITALAGTIYPVRAKQVKSTGTSATDLVGLRRAHSQ